MSTLTPAANRQLTRKTVRGLRCPSILSFLSLVLCHQHWTTRVILSVAYAVIAAAGVPLADELACTVQQLCRQDGNQTSA